MSAHEIENLFLQPELLRRILADIGRDPDETLSIIQRAADPDAGRWAFEKAKREEDWREDARPTLRVAGQLSWDEISSDPAAAAARVTGAIPGIRAAEIARRRAAIRERFDEYERLRDDEATLSRDCLGKESLPRVASELGFKDVSAIEARAAVLWRRGEVPRPAVAAEIRAYLDSVPVLRG
jgi:hypothetical protein